jgi:(2S)-methylsuccinyl-CoA dehydrogenase
MSEDISAGHVGMHRLASDLLEKLRKHLDLATDALAGWCSVDGKLSQPLQDTYQVSCYELALASADVLAAEVACSRAESASELDQSIAYAFIADSIGVASCRLDTVVVDLRLEDFGEPSFAAEFIRFRRRASSGEVLSSIGGRVAHSGSGFAEVDQSETVAMAHTAFRKFAREVIAPLAEDIHRNDLTVPRKIIDGMRAMGAFGLSIPEEYGGSAGDGGQEAPLMIAVTEALSEASLAAGGSLITRPEILSRALMVGGTDAQKKEWLPRIASGECLCAIAITEPDFGSDVARLALNGDRVEAGWILNGAKTWCTFAGVADLLMVVARTNPDKSAGHRGLSVMLVEKPSYDGHEFRFVQSGGGVLSGKAIPTIGYRGMHSFDLHFDNFVVSDQNLVGGEAGLGQGFYFTMSGMTGGRIQTAGRAAGVMRAALTAAIQYAENRRVFGQPLIDFPLTRARIASMAARYYGCRQLTYAVAEKLGSGDAQMEASLAKLLACRSAEVVTRDALQLHGGMGYAEESAVSRYFVDARVLSIFEGAEETLALKVIARSLLEAALLRAKVCGSAS